jgi:hypothetical protein
VRPSNEKGICLNKGRSKNPDLWFPVDGQSQRFEFENDGTVDELCEQEILGKANTPHSTHFLLATTAEPCVEATIKVIAEDFGAFGWIRARAEGCEEIPPRDPDWQTEDWGWVFRPNCNRLFCETGSNQVKIPRDDNDNNIADCAAQDACGAGEEGARQDEDETPPSRPLGDGLTAYEEYRGFIIGGGRRLYKHVRTDILKKDVFIFDPDDLMISRGGLRYFQRTGLTVHLIGDKELMNDPDEFSPEDMNCVLNFNRGYASGGVQHGIWLKIDNELEAEGRLLFGKACLRQARCFPDRPEYSSISASTKGTAGSQGSRPTDCSRPSLMNWVTP